MKKQIYKVALTKEELPMAEQKKKELMLRDLLATLPTLQKHKLEGEVHKLIKTLRDGRKKKHYVIELSRKFPTYDETNGNHMKELKVSSPVTKVNKVEILKKLKADIIKQIKDLRQAQKTPIDSYTFREGVTCNKMAEVYLESGVFVKVQDKKLRRDLTRRQKAPTTDHKYVGVEIEFASVEDREFLADRIHEAGLSKHIYIRGDASIGNNTKLRDKYPNPHEINVCAREEDIVGVITKLCTVLNTQMQVKVDKTCGLHVHLDMRNRDYKTSFSNLVLMQHFLYGMVPANRKTSDYSQPVKDRAWKISTSHYDGISTSAYAKYKTIEIRMHCGTTNAVKIGNWINFLLSIINAPALTYSPERIEQVAEHFKLTTDMTHYINGRISKFSAQHKKVEKSSGTYGMSALAPVEVGPDTTEGEESEVA